jgi:hypothetical protein
VGRRGEEFSAVVIWASLVPRQIGRKWFMGFAELFIALPDMYEPRRSTRFSSGHLDVKALPTLQYISALVFAM